MPCNWRLQNLQDCLISVSLKIMLIFLILIWIRKMTNPIVIKQPDLSLIIGIPNYIQEESPSPEPIVIPALTHITINSLQNQGYFHSHFSQVCVILIFSCLIILLIIANINFS